MALEREASSADSFESCLKNVDLNVELTGDLERYAASHKRCWDARLADKKLRPGWNEWIVLVLGTAVVSAIIYALAYAGVAVSKWIRGRRVTP
jgi:hypothetical protein